MKISFFLIILLFGLNSCSAQAFDDSFFIGDTEDSAPSIEKDSVISLLRRYNQFVVKEPLNVKDFWDTKTLSNNVLPDYVFKSELSKYSNYSIKTNLIFIENYDSIWIAKLAYHLFLNEKFKGACCVNNYAIKKQNSNYKLTSFADTYNYNTKSSVNVFLNTKPPLISSQSDLDSLCSFNKKLAKIFKVSELKFSCYKYANFAELNHCIGLDVQYNSSYLDSNAYTDFFNNKIYSSTSLAFLHEVVHLYTHKYIPNIHQHLDEGFATMLGGSNNLSLEQHLKKLALLLKNDSSINLNNFLDYRIYVIDKKTKFRTIMGSLFCLLSYEKNGYDGVIKLLNSGNTDEDFYKGIEQNLGLKRSAINEYVRKKLVKYLK